MATTKEYKKAIKQWKKDKKRTTRKTRIPAILCAIVAVFTGVMFCMLSLFEQTVYFMMATKTYTVETSNESEEVDSEYYKSSFSSDEERRSYGTEINERLEEEGAVLLFNKDNTLPLASGSKVSCVNQSSVDPIYTAVGSDAVDTSNAVSLQDGLENAGFVVNKTLWDFYTKGAGKKYRRSMILYTGIGSYSINEVPWSVYTEEAKDSISEYDDAAIFVISRAGGEGEDLPIDNCKDALDGNYLTLNTEEREVLSELKAMKKSGQLNKIIVLINSSNAIELDFLQDDAYSVDACLWIGELGPNGANSIGRLLSGEATPSGHLVDTYCYDNLTSPAVQNFGSYTYTNADTVTMNATKSEVSHYLVYQEGIYVGYKYYETRYEDVVMGAGNTTNYDYHADVAYPFGYGLSYTTFTYSDYKVTYDETKDTFDISVTVTNTGDTYSGKEVVEIYAQSPYTTYDQENGIEKASVELCGFTKTGTLSPGEKEEVKITVDRKELACYDAYGEKTYILEDGTYYLTAAADAHEAVNNILSAKGYTPRSTNDRMDSSGNTELVYTYENSKFDKTTYSVSKNGTKITNQFDNADLNLYDEGAQEITYLSRSDWEGTFPTGLDTLEITELMKEDLATTQYEVSVDTDEPTAIDSGLSLISLKGKSFDDPLWETLLDELSYEDMVQIVTSGFHGTLPVDSIQLPGTVNENGPQGLTAVFAGRYFDSSGFPCQVIVASTWNLDLISELGRCIGEDCLANDCSGVYAPGANIHRTPYSGRNNEYYSEDGFLSEEMSSVESAAITKTGTYVLLKHCFLNDEETNRAGVCIWANEQSLREIYLKAFEKTMVEQDSAGVMTSYTRIGCTWNGAHTGLLKNVLRGEWGNHGVYVSDNTILYKYMNAADGLVGGSTRYIAFLGVQYRQLKAAVSGGKVDSTLLEAMREACHYSLYCIVNSNAMNGITSYDTVRSVYPLWRTALNITLPVSLVGFVVFTYLTIKASKKYKIMNPKPRK